MRPVHYDADDVISIDRSIKGGLKLFFIQYGEVDPGMSKFIAYKPPPEPKKATPKKMRSHAGSPSLTGLTSQPGSPLLPSMEEMELLPTPLLEGSCRRGDMFGFIPYYPHFMGVTEINRIEAEYQETSALRATGKCTIELGCPVPDVDTRGVKAVADSKMMVVDFESFMALSSRVKARLREGMMGGKEMQERNEFVYGIQHLKLLVNHERESLVGHFAAVSFNSGEVIYGAEQVGERVFFLRSGVAISVHEDNPFKELHRFEPGDSFGEIARQLGKGLDGIGKNGIEVHAVGDVVGYWINSTALRIVAGESRERLRMGVLRFGKVGDKELFLRSQVGRIQDYSFSDRFTLAEFLESEHLQKGHVIPCVGDGLGDSPGGGRRLYFIEEGSVAVKDATGRTVRMLRERDAFGEISCYRRQPVGESVMEYVITSEKAKLHSLSMENYSQLPEKIRRSLRTVMERYRPISLACGLLKEIDRFKQFEDEDLWALGEALMRMEYKQNAHISSHDPLSLTAFLILAQGETTLTQLGTDGAEKLRGILNPPALVEFPRLLDGIIDGLELRAAEDVILHEIDQAAVPCLPATVQNALLGYDQYIKSVGWNYKALSRMPSTEALKPAELYTLSMLCTSKKFKAGAKIPGLKKTLYFLISGEVTAEGLALSLTLTLTPIGGHRRRNGGSNRRLHLWGA